MATTERRKVQIGPNASEIKDALRKRHPAYDPQLAGVGQWTCLEEWQNIDLLALDAWASGKVVGYEVKVSRGDMRTELLNPSKRSAAVAMCTEFYFAVPAGLLKSEELAFEEPDWTAEDFERDPCKGIDSFGPTTRWDRRPRYGGQCQKLRGLKGRARYYSVKNVPTGHLVEVPIPVTINPTDVSHYPESNQQRMLDQHLRIQLGEHGTKWVKCPSCQGKGHSELSRVERESPTLWVPKDVGLVSVGPNGCSVIKPAPKRKVTEPIIPWPFTGSPTNEDSARRERQAINIFARWISARPDPRHRRSYSDTVDS